MSKYPSLQSWGGNKGNKSYGECEACSKPATGYVRVSWDYMRGNDDDFIVCQRHLSMAQKQLSRFLAHVGTKEKFIAKAEGKS